MGGSRGFNYDMGGNGYGSQSNVGMSGGYGRGDPFGGGGSSGM